MTRLFIGLMICLFFLNCDKKKGSSSIESKAYIITYEDVKFSNYLKKKNIPPPPKGFYNESQLIIDKKGHFYYYEQKYTGAGCGTGMKNDTLPHFLDLQPKDIIRVPEKNLNDFLSENILTKEKNRQILIIASQNDTIKNVSFLDFLNKNQLRAYLIRRTTQEEDTVLKYKKENKLYIAEDIKWDKNRITFPFVKPQLQNK